MLRLRGSWGQTGEAELITALCNCVTYSYMVVSPVSTVKLGSISLARKPLQWLGWLFLPARLQATFLSILLTFPDCNVELEPSAPSSLSWSEGCGNSGHFLHAATTAVVHKHPVSQKNFRPNFKWLQPRQTHLSITKLSHKLSFYAKYFLEEQ